MKPPTYLFAQDPKDHLFSWSDPLDIVSSFFDQPLPSSRKSRSTQVILHIPSQITILPVARGTPPAAALPCLTWLSFVSLIRTVSGVFLDTTLARSEISFYSGKVGGTWATQARANHWEGLVRRSSCWLILPKASWYRVCSGSAAFVQGYKHWRAENAIFSANDGALYSVPAPVEV